MERTWRRLLIVVRACRFVRGAGGLWNGVWEFKGTPQPPVLCVMSNIRHGACWCITAYPRVRREPCTPAATRSISNEPPRRRRDVDVTAPAARRPGGSLPRGPRRARPGRCLSASRAARGRTVQARRRGAGLRLACATSCALEWTILGSHHPEHAPTRSVLRPIHVMIRVVIMTWIGSDPTVQLRTGGRRVGASGVAPSAYRKRNSDRDGEPATHRRPAPRAPTDMVRLDAPPQLPSPATCSPPFTAKAQRPEQAGGAGASSM